MALYGANVRTRKKSGLKSKVKSSVSGSLKSTPWYLKVPSATPDYLTTYKPITKKRVSTSTVTPSGRGRGAYSPITTGFINQPIQTTSLKPKSGRQVKYIPYKSTRPTSETTPADVVTPAPVVTDTGIGVPTGTGGDIGIPTVPGFPEYTVPDVNIAVPDLTWNPDEAMRQAWLEQARKRAALVVDPEIQAVAEALRRFKQEAEAQRAEINPRYTAESLAIANMIKNTIKQDIIDEAIRRGAETSGELPRQLAEAGRYEVEQRKAIEDERNRLLNAIAKQVLAKEQETSERQKELERIRGLREAVELSDLEKEAWNKYLTQKQSTFENQLALAQLRNAMAAAQAEQAYKNRLLQAQLAQQAWERQQAEKELALESAWQRYKMAQQTQPVQVTPREEFENALYEQLLKQLRGQSFYTNPYTTFKMGRIASMPAD